MSGDGSTESVMRIGQYYDDYTILFESGQPALMRFDRYARPIMSPSAKSSPDAFPTGQTVVDPADPTNPILIVSTLAEDEKAITIKAYDDNDCYIYIGTSELVAGHGGAGNGYELSPGESIKIEKQAITDTEDGVYMAGEVVGDGVSWGCEANQEAV